MKILEKFIAGTYRALPQKVYKALQKTLEKEAYRKKVNATPANVIARVERSLENVLLGFSEESLGIKEEDIIEGEDIFKVVQGQNTYVHFEDGEYNEKNYFLHIISPYFRDQNIIIGFKFLSNDQYSYEAILDFRYQKDSIPNLNQRVH